MVKGYIVAQLNVKISAYDETRTRKPNERAPLTRKTCKCAPFTVHSFNEIINAIIFNAIY